MKNYIISYCNKCEENTKHCIATGECIPCYQSK